MTADAEPASAPPEADRVDLFVTGLLIAHGNLTVLLGYMLREAAVEAGCPAEAEVLRELLTDFVTEEFCLEDGPDLHRSAFHLRVLNRRLEDWIGERIEPIAVPRRRVRRRR